MIDRDRLELAALICFFLFVSLGLAIVKRPRVLWDVRAKNIRARYVRAALFFTLCGRTRPLLAGYALAFAIYALGHLHAIVPVIMAASQVLSQSVVEGFKLIYKRARPEYWEHRFEKGHSFPSGHATTATVTFVGWAIIAAHAALPHPETWLLVALLSAFAAGIGWSRLVLGAHYFSDVFGGALFGAAWLCALFAFFGNRMLV